MSTLRISNIEAKSVPASATIDEKVKITNSSGDPLVFIDGKTSGITTVGINTTDPNITFDANSNIVVTGIITATKFVGTIEPTNLTISGDLSISDKIIHSGDTNTSIRFPSSDTITFETAGSEKVRIISDGKVGIGTITPGTTLHLSSATPVIRLTDTDTAGPLHCDIESASGDLYLDTGSVHRDVIITSVGKTNEIARFTGDGQVGIGTDTMNAPLTVVQNDNNGYIASFRQENSGNSAQILIDSPTDNNIRPTSIDLAQAGTVKWSLGQAYAAASDRAFHIATSSLSANDTNAKLTITTAGRVGIGTNNPTDILDINSDSASAVTNMYLRNHANLGGAALNIWTQGTYASPTYKAIIGCSDLGGNIRMGAHSNHELLLLTNNTTRVTVKTSGDVEIADGNLIVASGHGIDFSANGNAGGMTSELLDIYEEGSWTPYIYPMSSNIPVTYSHQSGRYTRIGNVVHFQFKLQVSNITGNRNQGFGINGFPFNNTGSQDQVSSEFYGETWSGEMPTTIKWIGNTNRGVCYFYNSSQQYQASSMLDINVSNSMLMGSGHYLTH